VRVALLALALLSCVSGQIRSGEDRRPPRIPFNFTDPKPGLVVVTDAAAQLPMTFRVLQFEEPNLEDTLTIRWFVDYHRNPAIRHQAIRPPEPQSSNPMLRSESSFILTQSMLEPNPAAEPHLVEVVVSDRPFDDNPQAPLLNRTLVAGAEGDVLSWTVQILSSPAQKPAAPALDLEARDPPSLPRLWRPLPSLLRPDLRWPEGGARAP
jgi:hypothetical protein